MAAMKILEVHIVHDDERRDHLAVLAQIGNGEPFRAVLVTLSPDHRWEMISENVADAFAHMFREHPCAPPATEPAA